MKLNKAATAAFAGTLIGAIGYSAAVPAQVQAKASYQVQITKNASVYTSKGKKTKTVYKKNKVLTAFKTRKIKGKYYYDLGKYVRTSYAKKYCYKVTIPMGAAIISAKSALLKPLHSVTIRASSIQHTQKYAFRLLQQLSMGKFTWLSIKNFGNNQKGFGNFNSQILFCSSLAVSKMSVEYK